MHHVLEAHMMHSVEANFPVPKFFQSVWSQLVFEREVLLTKCPFCEITSLYFENTLHSASSTLWRTRPWSCERRGHTW